MEMAQVRYFLVLCQERNFTRAARICGVAQPSLTKAIKTLEREVGGPLFERAHNGARLTALGTELEPYFAAIARCAHEITLVSKGVSPLDVEIAQSIIAKLGLTPPTRVPTLSLVDQDEYEGNSFKKA